MMLPGSAVPKIVTSDEVAGLGVNPVNLGTEGGFVSMVIGNGAEGGLSFLPDNGQKAVQSAIRKVTLGTFPAHHR